MKKENKFSINIKAIRDKMGIKFKGQEEKYKILVMAILLAGACFLTYYFHAILETGRIFTHFFYVPIILACIWWRRKGLVVAIFLAVLLSLSHTFIRIAPLTANDYLRALMFIAIAFVVSTLSERIAKAREKSTHLNAILDAIRKVNQLIIKEKDWDLLLQGVCDTLIQTRGYYNAWIALFDEFRNVVATAEAGLGEDFLPVLEMLKRGELTDCGLRALKQSDVVAVEDPSSTCADCPVSDKYGGRGAITARVEHNGKLYGLLTVSIPRDLVANEEEQILLKDVADDIALAMHSIELEKERKQAEEALRESEEKYRSLTDDVLDSSAAGIFILDSDFRVVWVNQALEDYFGLKRNEIIGKDKRQLIRERIKDIFENPDIFSNRVFTTYDDNTYIERFECHVLPNGEREERWLEHRSQPIQSGLYTGGRTEHYYDITKRKRAEEQIQASLKEKEVLLKEIHHRVKNNLQVISSLLNLQSQHIKDKESLEMFKESQSRIRAMALIHEKLYQSKDMARIDIAAYIQDLTAFLFNTYTVSNAIKVTIAVTDIFLDITTAIPCGLIINELVSNALKHAFPQQREGTIAVSMTPSNKDSLILTVSDNGIGFPEDIDFRNTESLGMQLVITLVEQFEGTIELDRAEGTAFKIRFSQTS